MQETAKHRFHRFIKLRTQRRRAYAMFTALAILVSVSTTCLLIRPASTMTAEVICGLEEHTHSEACYARALVCSLVEEDLLSGAGTQQETPPIQEDPPVEEDPPGEAPPPVVEDSPGEEPPPVAEDSPGEEPPPVAEDSPGEEPPAAVEHIPGEEAPLTEETVPIEEPSDPEDTPMVGFAVLNQPHGEEAAGPGTETFAVSNIIQTGSMLSNLLVFHSPADGNSPLYAPAAAANDGEESSAAASATAADNTDSTAPTDSGGEVSVADGAPQGEDAPPEDDSTPGGADSDSPEDTTGTPDAATPPVENTDASNGTDSQLPQDTAGTPDAVTPPAENTDTPNGTDSQPPEDAAGTPDTVPPPAENTDVPNGTDSQLPQDTTETPDAVTPPAENTDVPNGTDSQLPQDATETPDALPPLVENGGASGGEAHIHTEGCYTLIAVCGREEHIHEGNCYVKQGSLMMVLPEGAAVPEGYDTEYRYIDPENRFGVLVYAPAQALPEDAVLAAQLLEEDSDAYTAAEEALESMAAESPDEEPFTYDGFVALDIHFLLDGKEVEPSLPVYVCIHAAGLLPENADPTSVAVQHHAQETQSLLGVLPLGTEVSVEVVADDSAQTGALETADNSDTGMVDVMAAFEVEGFSVFTATYSLVQIPTEGWDGWSSNDFYTFEVDAINHYQEGMDTILFYGGGMSVSSSGYFPADMDWSGWYGIRVENRQGRYQVIQRVAHGRYASGSSAMPNNNVAAMGNQNLDGFILLVKGSTPILPYDAATYDSSKFMTNADATDDNGDFMVVAGANKYKPAAHWPEGSGSDHTMAGSGDSAVLALDEVYSQGDAWKTTHGTVSAGSVQVALYPAQWPDYLTHGAPDVVDSVSGNDAIEFQLFNYSRYINKTSATDTADGWRDISRYFLFRGEEGTAGTQVRSDLPATNRDNAHDEDGFTKHHATVERKLDGDGFPVLDLTRNADGSARTDSSGTPLTADALLTEAQRSMAYLFRSGDHAVTAYTPDNTILQYDEASGTYRYDSRENAVDYDAAENRFYVRNYVERNDDTASSDQGDEPYYDFLPFNHTGGLEIAATSGGYGYQLDSGDVDYWFGMRMDVDFYQVKDGQYKGSDMVFNFSGDDDVWVFIDDVLVLDLGGTHGMVSGSINFATGEVEQYLDWNGTTAGPGHDRYFATTIQECFDEAGATPNNGWKNYNEDGNSGIFADYTPHTLSFFYLERGSSVANCMIDFNLPTVPEQSLTVTKEVEDPGGAIADDTPYTFRVLQENGAPFVEQGDSYTLLEHDEAQGTRTVTAEDGSFQLMAGQSARFEKMLQFHPGVTTYLVEELLPNGEKARYSTVAWQAGGGSGSYAADTEGVAGETDTSYPTPALSAEATQMVAFTNTVKPGDLTLRKVVYRTDGMEAAPQGFTFEITGPAGTYLTSSGESVTLAETAPVQVSITADTPLTIFGLPAGASVCVAETGYDGFAVRWKHDNGTQDTSDDVEVLGDAISDVPIGIGSTTTLTCTNTTGPVLPNTGGTGTHWYTAAGIATILGASALFVQHRKKVFPKD